MTDIKDDVKPEDNQDDEKPAPPVLSEEETRAMNLGWKPKDQWQGGEDDWVPAKWWLKYGDVEQKAIILEQQDKHKDKVIKSMKGYYVRVKEDAKQEILQTIKAQKREAIKNEDFQKVAELDAQADLLESGLQTRFAETDKGFNQTEVPQGPPPEFQTWNRDNSWYKYGSTTDEMTVEADTLAIGYANKNPGVPYDKVLKYVETNIKRMFPDKFKKADEPMPNSVVDDGGSVNQTPTKPTTGKYKLTEAEKVAAREFDMTEEEYGKELAKFDGRKGLR